MVADVTNEVRTVFPAPSLTVIATSALALDRRRFTRPRAGDDALLDLYFPTTYPIASRYPAQRDQAYADYRGC